MNKLLIGVLIAGALLSQAVEAQTVNRKATLGWSAPTTCVSGAAITTCPVSGYLVQKLVNNSWVDLGNTAANVLTYIDQNLPVGTYTYRIVALSTATSPSEPSNQVSKTLDAPAPPGNPTITITVTITP